MRSASGDTSGRVISVMAAVWDVLSESDTAERAEWGVREEHNECNDSHQTRRCGEKNETGCKIKRVRDWVWCMRKTRQREIERSSWTLFGFGFANSESLSMVKALLFTPEREIASSKWKKKITFCITQDTLLSSWGFLRDNWDIGEREIRRLEFKKSSYFNGYIFKNKRVGIKCLQHKNV